jgi:hypothetical protein
MFVGPGLRRAFSFRAPRPAPRASLLAPRASRLAPRASRLSDRHHVELLVVQVSVRPNRHGLPQHLLQLA